MLVIREYGLVARLNSVSRPRKATARRVTDRQIGAPQGTALVMSAFGGKADVTLRLCTVGFLFRLRHSGRFVPTTASAPFSSRSQMRRTMMLGNQTHDRGNDQRHQELAHGCGLVITE